MKFPIKLMIMLFWGIFDIGMEPKYGVRSILPFNPHKVQPTHEMRDYLKSVYDKAIELSDTLYYKPQWMEDLVFNDFKTLSVKPRIWNQLVTQEHKDKK